MNITGAHVILFSTDAAADRDVLRDVFGFPSVDAGGGWSIFALPPAEVAVHPAPESSHRLFLMCANLDETVSELESRGIKLESPIREESWGRIASFTLPSGSELSIYEPHHPSPLTG